LVRNAQEFLLFKLTRDYDEYGLEATKLTMTEREGFMEEKLEPVSLELDEIRTHACLSNSKSECVNLNV